MSRDTASEQIYPPFLSSRIRGSNSRISALRARKSRTDASFPWTSILIMESATMIRLLILLWIASRISLDRFVVISSKYDLVLRFMAIRSSDAFHMETPNTKIRITDSNPQTVDKAQGSRLGFFVKRAIKLPFFRIL